MRPLCASCALIPAGSSRSLPLPRGSGSADQVAGTGLGGCGLDHIRPFRNRDRGLCIRYPVECGRAYGFNGKHHSADGVSSASGHARQRAQACALRRQTVGVRPASGDLRAYGGDPSVRQPARVSPTAGGGAEWDQRARKRSSMHAATPSALALRRRVSVPVPMLPRSEAMSTRERPVRQASAQTTAPRTTGGSSNSKGSPASQAANPGWGAGLAR
jgi:hypothetical protein